MGDILDAYLDQWFMEGEFTAAEHYEEGDRCPACAKERPVVWRNRKTEQRFLGCGRFPTCLFSAPEVEP